MQGTPLTYKKLDYICGANKRCQGGIQIFCRLRQRLVIDCACLFVNAVIVEMLVIPGAPRSPQNRCTGDDT